MKGQWIGEYAGSNSGAIIVNIDEHRSRFQGVAYINDSEATLPNLAAFFDTLDKKTQFQFRAYISPIHPRTGTVDSWENVKAFYADGMVIPEHVEVEGSWDGEILNFSWTSTIGTHGECALPKSKASEPSELVSQELDWNEYKREVSQLENRSCIFRGQSRPWRLRTSFHRTGRADLNQFINQDIPDLHKHLSARTVHVFNLEVPNENGAFFNLVQHHGYPTPLLDWTFSPYVAAFFAYRSISNAEAEKAAPEESVRIHVFNHMLWKNDFNQLQNLLTSGLHLSISEFLAIENERMIPQQSVSTVTNIDDIESYILSKESPGKKYLTAIDLPLSQRTEVFQELGYMGLTAGALFPGLDGACEELRERYFVQ